MLCCSLHTIGIHQEPQNNSSSLPPSSHSNLPFPKSSQSVSHTTITSFFKKKNDRDKHNYKANVLHLNKNFIKIFTMLFKDKLAM